MRGVQFGSGVKPTLLAAAVIAAGAMSAGETSAKASGETIGIELNKLSDEGASCQAYFVFDNQGGADYGKLKLDLVVFNADDVIERRFAMEVAPLDAKKRTVKLFEMKKMSCDKIGSFLINGVLECKQGTKTRSDCVQRLVPSSRVDVKLTK
ncbi:hypothetical protein AUC68_10760 [Methyloceanibacter methanicus]|uniref:Tat pathway signal sequence domain protein n=1 Tax=Methyloceanibacter methanicus TaxID=1774968 RepID=A0A1E3VWS4_9HYPH|nr:hypothetical protein [Methyloceanibacter methanicus]ODR97985.1 hypothetical protein AUC68_10760 [Methyloceanibacter methanicus]